MEVVGENMEANDHLLVIRAPRTKRPRPSSPLASAASSIGGSTSGGNDGSSSSTIEFFKNTEEEEDMANCLILLAHGGDKNIQQRRNRRKRAEPREGLDGYECKTCNRSFPSFQALGGHRASHKKPPKAMIMDERKGLGEGEFDTNNINSDHPLHVLPPDHHNTLRSNNSKSKVHECSICGAEFSSGQALGGHMRRHRNATASTAMNMEHENDKKTRNVFALDLNLPAPEEDVFASKQPSLVFSTPALVDCHY